MVALIVATVVIVVIVIVILLMTTVPRLKKDPSNGNCAQCW